MLAWTLASSACAESAGDSLPRAASDAGAGAGFDAGDAGRPGTDAGAETDGGTPREGCGIQTDRFEVPGPPSVDVLFVVDTAEGFEPLADGVAANLARIGAEFDTRNPDLQVGFTTSDMESPAGPLGGTGGVLAGFLGYRVLGTGWDDLEQSLPERLRELPTGGGANRLFDAARRATGPDAPQGPQDLPLVRSAAVLSVVAISPRDDASEDGLPAVLRDLLAVKGFRNTQLLSFTAISGGRSGCLGDGFEAEPAPRLAELAEETGGAQISICDDDFSRDLIDSTVIIPCCTDARRTRWFLANQPVPDSIRVIVGGEELSARSEDGTLKWSYEFATNSVGFGPRAVPGPGQTFVVEYVAACP
jgi:hypothetical protein